MLGYYKYTREKIVEIIRKSPKTNDGFYYVKQFPELNNTIGKIDGEKNSAYYYPREIFNKKLLFNEFEIESYLSKKNNNLDTERMEFMDKQIYNIIVDFIDYDLDQKLPGCLFNLNELIDTSIYFINMKY